MSRNQPNPFTTIPTPSDSTAAKPFSSPYLTHAVQLPVYNGPPGALLATLSARHAAYTQRTRANQAVAGAQIRAAIVARRAANSNVAGHSRSAGLGLGAAPGSAPSNGSGSGAQAPSSSFGSPLKRKRASRTAGAAAAAAGLENDNNNGQVDEDGQRVEKRLRTGFEQVSLPKRHKSLLKRADC